MRRLLMCLSFACLAAPLRAAVVPALPFTDHAVLQRDKPIPVWGSADAGETISVAFAGHRVATTADASGRWRVDLPALAATATPADLVIAGTNTITLTDIVVGEVWLASGQSNMEWPIKDTYDAALDIPASARFPLIRHLRVGQTILRHPDGTSRTRLGRSGGQHRRGGCGTTRDGRGDRQVEPAAIVTRFRRDATGR